MDEDYWLEQRYEDLSFAGGHDPADEIDNLDVYDEDDYFVGEDEDDE